MLTHNDDILTRGTNWLRIADTPVNVPYIDLQFDDLFVNPITAAYGRPDGQWVRQSYEPNVWRYYNSDPDWVEVMCGNGSWTQYTGVPYNTIRTTFDCVGYGYTDEVTMMPGIFRNTAIRNCVSIDTSNCIDLASMFSTSAIRAIPALNTSKCKDFNHFAADCSYLTEVASGMDTSNGECMLKMFSGCDNLTTINPTISLAKANDTYTSLHNVAGPGSCSLFVGCSSLTSITVSGGSHIHNWSGTSSNHWGGMFAYCTALTNIYGSLDTSSATVTDMMFLSCSNLQNLPFSINVSHIENMSYMFAGCNGFTAIPTLTNIANRSSYQAGVTLDWKYAFQGMSNVGAGAYSLYQELVSKGYHADSSSDECSYFFTQCGSNTAAGSSDLSQIPVYWGGMAN